MPARLSAFLIWAAAAAGVVFWALRLTGTPIAVPPGATLAAAGTPHADWSRLLGTPPPAVVAAPTPAAESTRFRLLGVIAEDRPSAAAGRPGRVSGVALLAIDGKPPRALRVGAPIEGGLMLQSVSRRGVSIGPPGAPASVTLELPPLPPPATGEPVRLRPDGSAMTSAPGLPAMPMAPPPPPGIPGMTPAPPPPGMPGAPTVGGGPATATLPPSGLQQSPSAQ